ncbi:MAG: N-acetyl-gamma-glutamyl-phosphate reductase, partial [Pseudohongiellaceae bacterium]
MKKFNVAIAGATGAVGEALISILEERDFPVAQLFQLARERSA